jgi:DNA-binding MarR family transcriptional regulator
MIFVADKFVYKPIVRDKCMNEISNLNDTVCYVFLLSKAYQKGNKLVQNRLSPYGLTNTQYLVLEVLWNNNGIIAADIGKLLNVDKATLSGILDRMNEAGWLRKEADPNDMRVFHIFPSQKAMALEKTLRREREAANNDLLSGFTMDEKILLRRLLLDII